MNPSQLSRLWDTVRHNFTWISVIDILAVTAIVYLLLRLVRGTRAVQLLKGVGVLLVLILVTDPLGLKGLNWLLSQALLPGVIALIILFQPELRLALERLGRGRIWAGAGLGVQTQVVARALPSAPAPWSLSNAPWAWATSPAPAARSRARSPPSCSAWSSRLGAPCTTLPP